MSIKVLKAGLYTTFVDIGREGYRSSGIGPAGGMDLFAMQVADFLAGNETNTAVIEMHFPTPEFLAEKPMAIGITGRGFDPLVDGRKVESWKPLQVAQGSVLSFEKRGTGARGYVAVHGGWLGSNWLGSFTTQPGIEGSGYHGRLFQKSDQIAVADKSRHDTAGAIFHWGISTKILDQVYANPNEFRCVEGPETKLLEEGSKNAFVSQAFHLGHQSNRMGYRLKGPALHLREIINLVSSPVDVGTVQLLPDGNLIILMADAQTTGGYPRIGFVCHADLPKLAQRNAGDLLHFKMISFAEAERTFLLMQKTLREIKQSCLQQFAK